MNRRLCIFVACLVLVAPTAAPAQPSGQPISREAWHAAIEPDGVQRVDIQCGARSVDPREIVVRAGVPVELTIRLWPGAPARAFGFGNADLPGTRVFPGTAALLRFTPVAPLDIPMACGVPDGTADDARSQAGRTGRFVVLPR